MESTITISGEIQLFLSKHEMTINRFAELSRVNSGTLSTIINENRNMSVRELDRITKIMEHEDGYFYDQYISEYIFRKTPSWRRIKALIKRSTELGKLDCIETIVNRLLENLLHVPRLFEMAEELFERKYNEAAMILYKAVSEHEKYQHSERLALCQFRLFQLTLGKDLDTNFKAATIFECYVDRLDPPYRLDALVELAYVYGTLHRWDKVMELAQELHRIATIEYEMESNLYRKRSEVRKSQKPIFSYILYSYLMHSVVYEERGIYDKALQYTSLYEDTDWIQEKTEESERIISQFKEWAIANKYLYRLLSGDFNALEGYVNYASSREDEIPTSLYKIVLAANLYNFKIDGILEQFAAYIPFKATTYKSKINEYNKPIMYEQYIRFLIELGKYYLRNDIEGGIKSILHGLDLSVRIHSERGIIKCMALFEQHRNLASQQAVNDYKLLVDEVQTLDEKKAASTVGFI